ncbi:MAG: hypothetical protein K8T91_09275 [Planctomycetes bacterium]|nr:hypothetical protein [Planctomycetota bacterium]
MAKKTSTAKPKQKMKPAATKTKSMSGKNGLKLNRPNKKTRKTAGGNAPFDQNHRELNKGQRGGQPGSLEDETLDPTAPYNKTYGRIRKSK